MTANFEEPLPPDKQRVQDAINVLIEHFDAVQIFACRYEANNDNNTLTVSHGQGCYHSRIGMAREFVLYEDECVRMSAHPEDD